MKLASAAMNIIQAIVIACLCILPAPSPVLRDSVCVLEINSYFDDEGRLVFSQLIGWEDNDTVRFWRLAKEPSHVPSRDWANGGYRVTFTDGERVRTVTAASFRETWTQWDVELANRSVVPPEQRRELRK